MPATLPTFREFLTEGLKADKIGAYSGPIKSASSDKTIEILQFPEQQKLTEEQLADVDATYALVQSLLEGVSVLRDQANDIISGPLQEALDQLEKTLEPIATGGEKITRESVTLAYVARIGAETISYKDFKDMLSAKVAPPVREMMLEIEADLKKTAREKYAGEFQLTAAKLPKKKKTISESAAWDVISQAIKRVFAGLKSKIQQVFQGMVIASLSLDADDQRELADRIVATAKKHRASIRTAARALEQLA